MRYVDKVIRKQIDMNHIYDYINEWEKTDKSQPIHEYLGLSEQDYQSWVDNPDSLKSLIKRLRKPGKRIKPPHIKDFTKYLQKGDIVSLVRTRHGWNSPAIKVTVISVWPRGCSVIDNDKNEYTVFSLSDIIK